MQNKYKRTFEIDEIDEVAREILTQLTVKVVCFEGTLGAGKTTLITALCKQLGVTESISSPTFGLVHEYLGTHEPMYHFDLYRLKNEWEAIDMGFEDYVYSGYFCFIEWADTVKHLLPIPNCVIKISIETETKRSLEMVYVEQ